VNRVLRLRGIKPHSTSDDEEGADSHDVAADVARLSLKAPIKINIAGLESKKSTATSLSSSGGGLLSPPPAAGTAMLAPPPPAGIATKVTQNKASTAPPKVKAAATENDDEFGDFVS